MASLACPVRSKLERPSLRSPSVVTLVAIALLAAGCAKKGSGEATPAPSASVATPAPPSSVPTASPPAPMPGGATSGVNDPMKSLFGRMGEELKHRPNVHPSVDDGFAAIAKAGVSVPKPAQSLAMTYKAAYCSHGLASVEGLSVLFCEYPDEAAMKEGLVEAKKVFPAMKTREALGRKTLLMVVTFQELKPKPETVAAQKKVIAAFNAL